MDVENPAETGLSDSKYPSPGDTEAEAEDKFIEKRTKERTRHG